MPDAGKALVSHDTYPFSIPLQWFVNGDPHCTITKQKTYIKQNDKPAGLLASHQTWQRFE